MQEKLRRCGIRSIDAVVDVTNYVMLELGQPMHAFDLASLKDEITVRFAKEGETLTLLNGNEAKLKADTLLITDVTGPLALAGIFGGLNSGVKADTTDILLESAFFAPAAIKNRAREYGLATDASHRFERGVDYTIQVDAIERATALLLDICGGSCGPVSSTFTPDALPVRNTIDVPLQLVAEVIGITIPTATQLDILQRLGMQPQLNGDVITVVSPSWRYDIAIPVDICEEIARIYGYDNIPNCDPVAPLRMVKQPEAKVKTYAIKSLLADLGYHEVVTYSFVEPKMLSAIKPDTQAIVLPSPISADMSAMRTTLWAGLINSVVYNLNRQATRMKLFEAGLTFIADETAENGIRQEEMLAGIICGNVADDSWLGKSKPVTFFDLKGDVEELLAVTANSSAFKFVRCDIPALHPGISAAITLNGKTVGYLGLIHPQLQKKLGLKQQVFLFELQLSALQTRVLPTYCELSKFPANKRDFAIVIDKTVTAEDVYNTVVKHGGALVTDVTIFDVYEGANLPENKKSMAFSITVQDATRTLEEDDIKAIAVAITNGLATDLNAKLRE